MVRAVVDQALGVYICTMGDAFNCPRLVHYNISHYHNHFALRSLARWCAATRLLSKRTKEAVELQTAKLPDSAHHALAILFDRGRTRKPRGVTHVGAVPLRCSNCKLFLRAPFQNVVRVDGSNPPFYVGETCCLLPKKRLILKRASIMKLLEVFVLLFHDLNHQGIPIVNL